MKNVIIIGAGQAGARAAFMLRENGWDGGIVLIGEEIYFPYERPPLSKDFLTGEQSLESLYIASIDQYKEKNIEVLLNTKVVEIFTSVNAVKTDKNELFSYEKLIIATGARARSITIPGSHLEGIYMLRDVQNSLNLNKALIKSQEIVILGGGFIGLEVAAAARKSNKKTTIIEQNASCLNRVLPLTAADPIINYHKENHVDIICGKAVKSINGTGSVESLTLDDGSTIAADLVVVGIGSVPNDELAHTIGLECPNGILINNSCQTSIENIYAIGDVACQYDSDYKRLIRLESWENAEKQAEIAAEHILSSFNNTSTSYSPWFWTDQFDLNIQVLGKPILGTLAATRAQPESRKYIQFYYQNQRLIGAVLFDSGKDKRVVSKLIGSQIDPITLENTNVALKDLISS